MVWEWWNCCKCDGYASKCVSGAVPDDVYLTIPASWVADACSGAPTNLGGSYTLTKDVYPGEPANILYWTYAIDSPVKFHTCSCGVYNDAYIALEFVLTCLTSGGSEGRCQAHIYIRTYMDTGAGLTSAMQWNYITNALNDTCMSSWTSEYTNQALNTACLAGPIRYIYTTTDYASELTISTTPP